MCAQELSLCFLLNTGGYGGGCNVFYSDVRIKSKKKGKEKERKEKEEMTSRVRERGYFRVKEFLE